VTEPDAVMSEIGRATELGQRGERQSARQLFTELEQQIGPGGDALHRVSLAHAMAGVAGPVAGFYPSLHLDLGEDYRKLGDLPAARRHLELGQESAAALGDDGYSRMTRGGLERLAARLTDL